MKIITTRLPKLCHARPGDVVRIPADEGIGADPALYLVAVSTAHKDKRAMRSNMSHGLYDEERPLFLVNVETGEARAMPHLSSRVEIVRNVIVEVAHG